MRHPIAYYMMLLYVTVMFKPIIPLVSDAFSHVFSESVHIATVHAMYGSNHLEKDLGNTSSENSNNKHQAGSNSEENTTVHVSSNNFLFIFSVPVINDLFPGLEFIKLTVGFISKLTPPPRFAS
ncbi:MAG: hypothetical protein ABI416_07190 [Ginsengibacter sp.]